MPSASPQDGCTDALVGELTPEREVDDSQRLQTAKPQQPMHESEPPWNEATLLMRDRDHHMDARRIAWQVWAEAARLRRMIEYLEDDSIYKI